MGEKQTKLNTKLGKFFTSPDSNKLPWHQACRL